MVYSLKLLKVLKTSVIVSLPDEMMNGSLSLVSHFLPSGLMKCIIVAVSLLLQEKLPCFSLCRCFAWWSSCGLLSLRFGMLPSQPPFTKVYVYEPKKSLQANFFQHFEGIKHWEVCCLSWRLIKFPQHPSAFSVTVLTVLAVAGETIHAPSPHIDWIPSAQLRRYFDSFHLLIDACYNSAEVPWLKLFEVCADVFWCMPWWMVGWTWIPGRNNACMILFSYNFKYALLFGLVQSLFRCLKVSIIFNNLIAVINHIGAFVCVCVFVLYYVYNSFMWLFWHLPNAYVSHYHCWHVWWRWSPSGPQRASTWSRAGVTWPVFFLVCGGSSIVGFEYLMSQPQNHEWMNEWMNEWITGMNVNEWIMNEWQNGCSTPEFFTIPEGSGCFWMISCSWLNPRHKYPVRADLEDGCTSTKATDDAQTTIYRYPTLQHEQMYCMFYSDCQCLSWLIIVLIHSYSTYDVWFVYLLFKYFVGYLNWFRYVIHNF